jgi:hypothetical protein
MATTKRSSSAVADEPMLDTTTEPEHPLAEAGQEVGQTAGHVAERAVDIGAQQADRIRMQAADGLQQLASSVRNVSSDLSDQPTIANLATTAADGAERFAGFLRETDARQMVSTVEDMARRQPLLFVGGALVLGVAASRFIKAAGGGGSSARRAGYGGTGYGATRYGTGYGSTTYGGADLGGYQATGPGGYRSDGLTTDPTDEGLRP